MLNPGISMVHTSNKWWEIEIPCHPDLEETLFWRLTQYGCKGMATHQQPEGMLLIKGYLPQVAKDLTQLSGFLSSFEKDARELGVPVPRCGCRLIDEEDWAKSWKDHWSPMEIGDRLLINPAWLPVPVTDRLVIKIEPGSAFGTGTHATTQLCLKALEMRLIPDKSAPMVGDLGCGSGILGVASLMLGAAKVYSTDTDFLAVKATAENVAMNDLAADRMEVEEGSIEMLLTLIPQPLDGFVCNILANTIIDLIPQMGELVKPGGWGILSGILSSQVPAVSQKLEEYHWYVGSVWQQNGWACLNIKRPVER
jgi:ribosomal protein L11 methyltransferase